MMAIYRTIWETIHHSKEDPPAGFMLNNLQTRTSINLDTNPPFAPIPPESIIDVEALIPLLEEKQIPVLKENSVLKEEDVIIHCTRFLHRFSMPYDECREIGQFLAKSFPFAKNLQKLANFIIGSMSLYPKWKAIQLRIEGDLLLFEETRQIGLETVTKNYLDELVVASLVNEPDLNAVYFATGVQEERYNEIVQQLNEQFPHVTFLRKTDILKDFFPFQQEFESLCLEQQALIDWLVCIGASSFVGAYGSSFAYLAGYMRHYRGFPESATQLLMAQHTTWDTWFPRV
ncbi:O-fucosyltransferase family protein [Paenibacillus enshidis]|uniref:O-fucosyltransferase family protein n=1 Tax=Paenibacillus enshidis TaxID=1458439 RepID=A0ABV5AXX8_9BACL